MNETRFRKRSIFLVLYLVFALLPIYWMINMSFKTNEEILSSFSLFPRSPAYESSATSGVQCQMSITNTVSQASRALPV